GDKETLHLRRHRRAERHRASHSRPPCPHEQSFGPAGTLVLRRRAFGVWRETFGRAYRMPLKFLANLTLTELLSATAAGQDAAGMGVHNVCPRLNHDDSFHSVPFVQRAY